MEWIIIIALIVGIVYIFNKKGASNNSASLAGNLASTKAELDEINAELDEDYK